MDYKIFRPITRLVVDYKAFRPITRLVMDYKIFRPITRLVVDYTQCSAEIYQFALLYLLPNKAVKQGVYHSLRSSILGDGAVDVGDDDFVVPVPQVDGALAAAGALVLRGDAEHDVVRALL